MKTASRIVVAFEHASSNSLPPNPIHFRLSITSDQTSWANQRVCTIPNSNESQPQNGEGGADYE